ncbi:MAG: hypothetical protein ACRDWA_15410 [Acidimicrobiia bacterium]
MPRATDEPTDDFFYAFMEEFTDAHNRGDVDAIESHYHIPFFSYKNGQLEVYLDAKSGRDSTVRWIEVNRTERPALWERISSSLTRQGLNSVLVTSRWAFRRPDGTAVWDFFDTYHLCRFEGRWLFLDRTVHD